MTDPLVQPQRWTNFCSAVSQKQTATLLCRIADIGSLQTAHNERHCGEMPRPWLGRQGVARVKEFFCDRSASHEICDAKANWRCGVCVHNLKDSRLGPTSCLCIASFPSACASVVALQHARSP